MNKSEIEKWLKRYKIINYTIHDTLVVDGHVDLYDKKLKSLPFQFGKVSGTFYCSSNKLTSLKYCPTTVSGGFYCSHNNLTSLNYCPTTVSGDFSCHKNSFKVIPEDYVLWIKAIEISPKVYQHIEKQATPDMKACHKLLWEL